MGVDDHLRMQPTTSLEEKTKRYTYARHIHPSLLLRVPLALQYSCGQSVSRFNNTIWVGQIPHEYNEYDLRNQLAATFGRLLPDGVMLVAEAGVDKSWALATFVEQKDALAAVGQGQLATGNYVLLIKQYTPTELTKADTRGLSGVTDKLETNIRDYLRTVKAIEQRGGGLRNGSHKPRSTTHHSRSHGHHHRRHKRHSKENGVKENEGRSTLALSHEEDGATTRATALEPGAPSARKSKACVVS